MRESNAVSNRGCAECACRLGSVLAELDAEGLDRLETGRVVHAYKRGQILHYEGNPATQLSCLRSGRAKVFKSAPRARQHILYLAEPGDVLGLESVIAEHVHSSTAEMIEDGIVCHLGREPLLQALESQPAALHAVARSFATRLLRSEAERAELASGSVRERVALTLLSLGRRYGVRTREGVRLSVALSRGEIAEMVGATAETTIRQLSLLRDEGLISTSGRMILIEDPERLGRVARLMPS